MSLLDELKQQADQQRKENDQNILKARLEAVYQQDLRPRMLSIFHYLAELTEQLKVVDLDVRHHYILPGIGEIRDLKQGEYIVNADSTDQIKLIRLRFCCMADQEQEYSVKPKAKADETRDFLESQKMRYAEWPIRDNTQKIVGITFQLTIKVEIQFVFHVDPEQGSILMATSNFNVFGLDRSVFQPERITDEWLDKLGNYILRRHQDLHALDIGATEKAMIRQRLEKERQARQVELEEAVLREEMELEEKRSKSLLGKFRKLGKSRGE